MQGHSQGTEVTNARHSLSSNEAASLHSASKLPPHLWFPHHCCSRLLRTWGRRGGAAGELDRDRCAPPPIAGRTPLPGSPLLSPIPDRAELQVCGGARIPTKAPAASALSLER